MKKIIRLTEQDLSNIVKKVLEEQNNINLYSCIPPEFRTPYKNLIEKKLDKQFLKVALGIIGRESHYASGVRYNTYGTLKNVWDFFGGDASHGPAQMTPKTAKDLGVDVDITSDEGALYAAYKYLFRSYNEAINVGYTTGPSNVNGGTGNAALDISIASYNTGLNVIKKWCKTNDKNINAPCDSPNKQYKPYPNDKPNYILTVSSQEIKNYVPNKSTVKKIEGVNTATHGYIKTVAENMKKLSCI
jgi:hypothetical protein